MKYVTTIGLGGLLTALGCAATTVDDGNEQAALGCSPGDVIECSCADGTLSTQVCDDTGTSYSVCGCAPAAGVPAPPETGTGGTAPTGYGGSGNVAAQPPTSDPLTTDPPTTDPPTTDPPTTDPPVTDPPITDPPITDPPLVEGQCCTDGNCLCHGPDPTEQSASTNGTYDVASYTNGFRDGPFFKAGTIYYPTNAEPPLAGVVICPGWTAVQSSIAAWGPFLASHGIVLMTIDTNTTGDSVNQRADALWDALTSLKEENTRAGSPLQGLLSPDRYGLMGWSMGGGGTWINGANHPELYTAISLAGHNNTAGGAIVAAGTTVPSFQFAGATDSAILGGGGQSQGVYDIIPETTPKILYEMAAEGHFSWGTPTLTNGGALGRYGLAFQKVFLEGDERYRSILLTQGPGASDWRSTVQ